MENLSAFLNPIKTEHKKVAISTRFVENGVPVLWELKAITAEEDAAIRKVCMKQAKGKKGVFSNQVDIELYLSKLAVACVVYPDLQNLELQNGYGVLSGEALLKKMLKSGEYTTLLEEIQNINGFDTSLEELIEEAKN